MGSVHFGIFFFFVFSPQRAGFARPARRGLPPAGCFRVLRARLSRCLVSYGQPEISAKNKTLGVWGFPGCRAVSGYHRRSLVPPLSRQTLLTLRSRPLPPVGRWTLRDKPPRSAPYLQRQSLGYAEKIVIPAKAGIQGFDFSGFCFWQKRFF